MLKLGMRRTIRNERRQAENKLDRIRGAKSPEMLAAQEKKITEGPSPDQDRNLQERHEMTFPEIKGGEWVAVKHLGDGAHNDVYLVREPAPAVGEDDFRRYRRYKESDVPEEEWGADIAREAAVKIVKSNADTLPQIQGLLKSEIDALAAVSNNPFILSLYDVIETADGRPGILMEYAKGGTLEKHLEREGGSGTLAAEVGIQLGIALESLRDHGLVNRDIKLANVMLQESAGELIVKLNDFDFAMSESGELIGAEEDASSPFLSYQRRRHIPGAKLAAGMIAGTPATMSPEQARGRDLDYRSDMYALGVVLYELFSGKHPYSDTKDNFDMMVAHINRPLPELSTVVPDEARTYPIVEKIIHALLSKKRDDRTEVRLDDDYVISLETPLDVAKALKYAMLQSGDEKAEREGFPYTYVSAAEPIEKPAESSEKETNDHRAVP